MKNLHFTANSNAFTYVYKCLKTGDQNLASAVCRLPASKINQILRYEWELRPAGAERNLFLRHTTNLLTKREVGVVSCAQ